MGGKPIVFILFLHQLVLSHGQEFGALELACVYNGVKYPLNTISFGEDCYEYTCQNGSWAKKDSANKNCCYYGETEYHLDWGEHKNPLESKYLNTNVGYNGSVPTSNCTDRVCIGYNKWELREADPALCQTCENEGYLYRVNWTRFGNDDCYEYICRDGLWEKTGSTDDKCCVYTEWYSWDDKFYSLGSEYRGPNATISLYNCTEFTCTSRNTWECKGGNMCKWKEMLYPHRNIQYDEDCREHECDNGKWKLTGESNRRCCYYGATEYHLDWGENKNPLESNYLNTYLEFNGSVPQTNCVDRVCIGNNKWELREADPALCQKCENEGYLYRVNWTRFGNDDCYEYICRDGLWEKTGSTDDKCCVYSELHSWNEYIYSSENRYYGLNDTISLNNCSEFSCISKNSWECKDSNNGSVPPEPLTTTLPTSCGVLTSPLLENVTSYESGCSATICVIDLQVVIVGKKP